MDQAGGDGHKTLAPFLGGRFRLFADLDYSCGHHGLFDGARQAGALYPVVASIDTSGNHHDPLPLGWDGHAGSAGSFGSEGSEGSGGIGMGITSFGNGNDGRVNFSFKDGNDGS